MLADAIIAFKQAVRKSRKITRGEEMDKILPEAFDDEDRMIQAIEDGYELIF